MNTKVLFDQSHANEYTLSEIERFQSLKVYRRQINPTMILSTGEQLEFQRCHVLFKTINNTGRNFPFDRFRWSWWKTLNPDPTRGEIDLSQITTITLYIDYPVWL